jgi:hypothetical protein
VTPVPVDPVVVLVGSEDAADALGAVAREVEAHGRRAAVFVGDMTDPEARAALHEMLDELFPSASS